MLFQRLVFLPGEHGHVVQLAGFLLGIIPFDGLPECPCSGSRVPHGFIRKQLVLHLSGRAELFHAHLPERLAGGVYSGRVAEVPDAGFRVVLVDGAPGGVVIFILAQGGKHQFPVQSGIGSPVKPEDAEVDGRKDGTDDDRGVDPEQGSPGLQHAGDFRG